MNYNTFKRAKRIRSWLETLAFFSLFLDIGIALTTLLSFKYNLSNLETIFNYALTIEVLLSILLFLLLVMIRHYEKVIDSILSIKRNFSRNKH